MRRPPLSSALFLAVLLLCAAVFVLYFAARNRMTSLQETVIQRVEQALQNNVVLEIGGARLGLRRGLGFRLYDLSLHERGDPQARILEARYLFAVLDVRALFRGEVRIQRIFVFQPRVFLSRDPAGKLNVDRLFSASYARQQARDRLSNQTLQETFGPLLWRDEISFKNGEMVYRDVADGGRERVRIVKVDLQVTNRLESDRLEIRALGEIVTPAVGATLDLQGDISGWKTAASLDGLSAALRLSLREGDLQGLTGCFGGIRPGDELRGTFGADLTYEGSLLLPGKGHLELVLEEPHVSLAAVHPHPFSPERVTLDAPFEAGKDGIAFFRSRIDVGSLPILWTGAFRFHEGKITHVDVDLSGEDLSLLEAKSYLPLGLLEGETWRFLTDMVKAGRVDARARLQGAPEDFSRLASPEGEDALYLWIRFRDCTVELPVREPYRPFHSAEGVLELSKGTLHFRGFRAAYGQTRIPEIRGSIVNLHQPVSHLSVQARARLYIPETFQELEHDLFPPAVRQLARSLQEADGKGTLQIRIDYVYGRQVEERLQVQGEAALEGVRATCTPLGISLTGVSGRVAFTEASVHSLNMNLVADRSPVRLTGGVRFGEETSGADGEFRFVSPRLHADDLAPWLGLGGRVSGSLHATGLVTWKAGHMGWQGALRADELEVSGGSFLFPARDLVLDTQGTADSLTVASLGVRVQDSHLSGQGRFESLKPLKGRVDLHASVLNLDRLLSQKRKKESPWNALIPTRVLRIFHPREEGGGTGTDVRLGVKCEQVIYRNFDASDVVIEGGVTSEKVRVEYAHGLCGGGSVIVQGDANLKDPNVPFSLLFGLSQIRTEAYARWFSFSPDFIEGTASLEGSLRGSLRPSGAWWKEVQGALSLYSDGCTIKRYDLLTKSLTLINFTQWTRVRLSDLYSRGLPCRQIKGNLRLQKGALSTEDLVLDTSIARVTFQGAYDVPQDRMDTEVTLQPMEQLDHVLDYLPLVGRVISGPDGNVVVFHYAVRGPLKDLRVELIPFKSLNERIRSPLQKLNGWMERMDKRLQGRDEP